MTTTLTLGLTVADIPMSATDAQAFVSETVTAVGTDPDTLHTGTGIWAGQAETSVILTWFDLPTLEHSTRESIARVARRYGQDAVVLMEAEAVFL